jgi:O-antigen ligase
MADERIVRPGVVPLPIVRYGYYAFVMSIPLETVDIGVQGGVLSLSKIVGYLFILIALLQPSICFRKPEQAFWGFALYAAAYVALGALQPADYLPTIVAGTLRLAQMLILFWVSFNLLQHEGMIKGTLVGLGLSCVVLACLQLAGVGPSDEPQGRVTALAENANRLGGVLSLGALALVGLGYARARTDQGIRVLAWPCVGLLCTGILMTGSRGAMFGFIVGILCLLTKGGGGLSSFKVRAVAILLLIGLAVASYSNALVRDRWERAFYKGNLAGREKVLPEAWRMFTESPLVGWGPVNNHVELGARFGEDTIDTHNLYLWVLTETGLLGGIPFFAALWICGRAAWIARRGPEGSLPIAMVGCIAIVNMAGTMLNHKLFWLALAYAVASGRVRALSVYRARPGTEVGFYPVRPLTPA